MDSGPSQATLKSIYSGLHTLEEIRDPQTRAIVVVFLDTECPIANSYVPRLTQLHQQLRDQHVVFLGVYANSRVDVWSMATHAHDANVPFPVFKDVDQQLADALGVKVTPEVVVLDGELNKKYQGPIDNQFRRGGSLPAATEHYLKDALTALLSGEEIKVASRPAAGCPLGRQQPLVSSKEFTFHRDVEPIVQRHCQACHRPEGVAPFSLLTYDDAYYNAERIAEVVGDRQMPPWHGTLNSEFGTLHNDKRLSDEEIEVLTGWAAHGAPEGDKKDAPMAVKWPPANAWDIAKPDYVYKMPQPFRVPKHGVLEYQFFRVPLNSPEDRWYKAVEVRPGHRDVVHHIAVHVVPAGNEQIEGMAAMAMLYGINTQRGNVIADYVPGDSHNAKTYPTDQACRIPKHSDLIFELHYTPNNRQEADDQSMVGFIWSDKAPVEEVERRVFRKPVGRFRIPPNDPHFAMQDSYYFETDVDLDAIRPHFHLRGKSYRLEIIDRNPDSGEITNRKTILAIPRFDQRWQRTYEMEKPLRIAAGTELLATVNFDNSKFNPNNPDPNKEVLWGQQTTDEMFSTWFRYRVAKDKP
jgi:hypothetical protein